VYVTGAPPVEAGGVNATAACPFPPVAVPMVGAPGVTAAMVKLMVPLVKLSGVGVLESVPPTVRVYVPAVVGVPLTAPVLEMLSPGGSEPLTTVVAKVYGP